MIRSFPPTIRKTRSRLLYTGYRYWTVRESRRPESGRGREPSTCGKRSIFRQITGTTVPIRSAGELPGPNIATDIWRGTGISITVPMRGRGSTESHRSTRVRLPEPWNRLERWLNAVRSTEKYARETRSGNRSQHWQQILRTGL